MRNEKAEGGPPGESAASVPGQRSDGDAASPMAPMVSAVVCTRDRPLLLRRAVRSVLAQDYPGRLECVVVVDSADPGQAGLLEDLTPHPCVPDRSLVVTHNRRKPGLAGARNTGIETARGELIAFCDDDDEWLPAKLTAQVARLREEPSASLVVTGIRIVTSEGQTTRVPPPVVTLADLLRSREGAIHPSSFLTQREGLFGAIGPVDEDVPYSYGEDYVLMLRAARQGPIIGVAECLTIVHWDRLSFFNARWDAVAAGLSHVLDSFPEFDTDRVGRARIRGQVAFALAAQGRRRQALRWAGSAWRDDPCQLRTYGAVAVAGGLVRPESLLAKVNARGKGL